MRLPLRRVQRSSRVQQSIVCIFLPADLAGAARRCRRPLIIGLLRPFPSLLGGGSNSSCRRCCWSASILPTGCHADVSLQCNSRAPHCTRGSLSLGLFAGPWPAVPIGRLPAFPPNFCMLLRSAGENNGCGDGDVVVRCEWWRCVLLLCCLSGVLPLFFLFSPLLEHIHTLGNWALIATVKFEDSERTNNSTHTHTHIFICSHVLMLSRHPAHTTVAA
ncbi:hypothetical protein TcCL_Unassigned05076 [Trypanosoma cruzi]|nr:hypothetical protein TcCL_Unassigned05076 [Trypanosoma cruzi]